MQELDECSSNEILSPRSLIEHLKLFSEKGGYIHKLLYKYLGKLYSDYWGNDIHHSALLEHGSPEYNKSESEKNQIQIIDSGNMLYYIQHLRQHGIIKKDQKIEKFLTVDSTKKFKKRSHAEINDNKEEGKEAKIMT
jgi:hypothetical protein